MVGVRPLVAAVLGLAAAHAAAAVGVAPRNASTGAAFTVSFRAPHATGTFASVQRHDQVSAAVSSRGRGRGCVASIAVRAPDAAAGARVQVVLEPRGQPWCTGTFQGTVVELQTPVCRRGRACPQYVIARTIGRFSFTVVRAPAGADTTPPRFGGIERAFACTPGPQRPGETTPFTLSWQPATDDRTPSASIIYDVYESATPGGEDLATPTWTTGPGATTYRTPGLPSHATFYFVVRARDQAGNEDANRVEVRGVDPCL